MNAKKDIGHKIHFEQFSSHTVWLTQQCILRNLFSTKDRYLASVVANAWSWEQCKFEHFSRQFSASDEIKTDLNNVYQNSPTIMERAFNSEVLNQKLDTKPGRFMAQHLFFQRTWAFCCFFSEHCSAFWICFNTSSDCWWRVTGRGKRDTHLRTTWQ